MLGSNVKMLRGKRDQPSDDIPMDTLGEHFIQLLLESNEDNTKNKQRNKGRRQFDSEIEVQIRKMQREKEAYRTRPEIQQSKDKKQFKEQIRRIWRGYDFPNNYNIPNL